MEDYDRHNWFWIVGGDETRAFSSAAGGYIDAAQAHSERATRIDDEAGLLNVLRAANIPPYHRGKEYDHLALVRSATRRCG